jgi:hypothetical protein
MLMALCLAMPIAGCAASAREQAAQRRSGPLPAASASSPAPPVSTPAAPAGNTTQQSFSAAKRALAGVYRDNRLTLYCGCSFTKDRVLDRKSCGYIYRC